MPYIAVAETAEDNRARFLVDTIDEAIAELATEFPVGKSVEERLRKGERIVFVRTLLDRDDNQGGRSIDGVTTGQYL